MIRRAIAGTLVWASFGLAALAQTSAPPAPPNAAPPPAAPPPLAETLALARRVAVHDDFLALVQMTGAAQIQGIEHGLGELTPAEKSKVESIGAAKLAEGASRVVDKMALAYAAKLTPNELRAAATFLESPAGEAYSKRLLAVLPALGEGMKGFDFKREVLAETCAQIKKGCPVTP